VVGRAQAGQRSVLAFIHARIGLPCGPGPMDNMSLAAEDMSFGATTLEYRSDAGVRGLAQIIRYTPFLRRRLATWLALSKAPFCCVIEKPRRTLTPRRYIFKPLAVLTSSRGVGGQDNLRLETWRPLRTGDRIAAQPTSSQIFHVSW